MNSSKDSQIKIDALSLLWSLGYVVRPELVITEQDNKYNAPRNKYFDLTDIDVLGYSFSPLLNMETVAIDCGTGKSRSPIERTFWARGLMEAVGLHQVICVVGRDVEEAHKLAADKIRVTLLSVNEFEKFKGVLSGKEQLLDFQPYYEKNAKWLNYLRENDSQLTNYLLFENWARDWERMPVVLPSHVRRWNVRLSTSKPIHAFGFLEIALLLSLSLVKISSHLVMIRPNEFPDAVRAIVLGGGQRAQVIDSLLRRIEQLDDSTRDQVVLSNIKHRGDVIIPNFVELLDVINRLANRASFARSVPRYIQAFQLAYMTGSIYDYEQFLGHEREPIVTKLALDVITYLCKTSDCVPDVALLFEGL